MSSAMSAWRRARVAGRADLTRNARAGSKRLADGLPLAAVTASPRIAPAGIGAVGTSSASTLRRAPATSRDGRDARRPRVHHGQRRAAREQAKRSSAPSASGPVAQRPLDARRLGRGLGAARRPRSAAAPRRRAAELRDRRSPRARSPGAPRPPPPARRASPQHARLAAFFRRQHQAAPAQRAADPRPGCCRPRAGSPSSSPSEDRRQPPRERRRC